MSPDPSFHRPRGGRRRHALAAVLTAVSLGACSARAEAPATPEPPPPPEEVAADSPAAEAAEERRREEAEREARREAEARRDEARRAEEAERAEERRRAEAEAARDAALPDVPLLGWARTAEAVLPRRRIVAFYGNPNSRNMGILGELAPTEMLARLDQEVAAWEAADPDVPVQPALHLIAVMATGDPGPSGLYRLRQSDATIRKVVSWAEARDALVFLDIQPGRSTVEAELPRLEPWLLRPNVHLALDPEWAVGPEQRPGQVIGSMRAADVNHAIRFLARLVSEHDLPPKVLVVHRFTQGMLRDPERIVEDPRVQVVLNMDGWGPPEGKRASYSNFVAPAPVPLKGFKLFYRNDRRGGSRLMSPAEVLGLRPVPIYIQYQ